MPKPSAIELDEVSKSFRTKDGELKVLDKLSFSVEEGESLVVVGPSGSGKSTLLNLLAGLDFPTSGSVLVDGKEIEGPDPQRGVIFQQYAVFPFLTVQQNVTFGLELQANRKPKREREEIAARYLKLMGLQGFEDAFPKTLSGGMKQRLAIARAYAVSPNILFMDEPFGALDAQTRGLMQEMILQILDQETKTVVFVTHSVEEAVFIGNRIVVVSARPATVNEIVDVPFDFPREHSIKTDDAFIKTRRYVEELVREQYAIAHPELVR